MSQSEKPIANPLVILREEFDDWAVLFNPDSSSAVGINPVGVAVWKLMNGKYSLEEIVAKISDSFRDVPDTALENIRSFVKDLYEDGFVAYAFEEMGP
ncbi:MAG: SynChlorMet cassette protein ScmD [Thermodesulfobacteriota bacterium]|nr:SynChlorMet cassette protein ScmD [Thermodesulfobacteriota bacterium]